MGAKLAMQAYAFANRRALKPNEHLVLVFMSLTALDADRPPRYFGSREQTARALGRMVRDAPLTDDPDFEAITRERTAAFQAVKIATAGLVAKGALKRTRRGREGQRAEFVLTLDLVDNLQSKGTKSLPLVGTESLPLSGSESLPQRVGNPYPQGSTKEDQEQTPGETSVPAGAHLGPVDKREAA